MRADTTQLQAVVLNLLANARDAVGDHGTVTVALASTVVPADAEPARERVRGRACARLSVADTGQGMSPEVLAHLFEPFFTTKPVGRGTGLGLATARGIIEAHGGAMHVESAPGRGSRFDVLLPCVGAA